MHIFRKAESGTFILEKIILENFAFLYNHFRKKWYIFIFEINILENIENFRYIFP